MHRHDLTCGPLDADGCGYTDLPNTVAADVAGLVLNGQDPNVRDAAGRPIGYPPPIALSCEQVDTTTRIQVVGGRPSTTVGIRAYVLD